MGNKLGRRQVVDDKYTRPQGLYQIKDVDYKKLRKLILESKLTPCYPGGDDCDCGILEECPICFLVYYLQLKIYKVTYHSLDQAEHLVPKSDRTKKITIHTDNCPKLLLRLYPLRTDHRKAHNNIFLDFRLFLTDKHRVFTRNMLIIRHLLSREKYSLYRPTLQENPVPQYPVNYSL